jgi:hypothetical protein
MDLNVENYSKQELTELLGVSSEPDKISIINAVREQIEELTNPDAIHFVQEAGEYLISMLPEPTSTNVYTSEVQRGTVNPDLKHTISRLVNLDSCYRQDLSNYNYSSDNFTLQLNEPINDVVSMFLYSIEIPQSWHTFTEAKGTIAFIIFYSITEEVIPLQLNCSIAPGNYTNISLMQVRVGGVELTTKLPIHPVLPPAVAHMGHVAEVADPLAAALRMFKGKDKPKQSDDDGDEF